MRKFDHEQTKLSAAMGFTELEFDTIQERVAEIGNTHSNISSRVEAITKEFTDPVELVFAGMVIGGALALSKMHHKKDSLWEELKK
jgi:hypothetical protein